ncbi:MAG: hypothetical protein KIS84_13560 [Dokdonella sp.]|nr:hypothetical protein [Dokdonella sp.]
MFDGAVVSGARHVLLDDFVGQGGTFANLRGHILSGGGIVDGAVALTGKAGSAEIALPAQTLRELRNKHADHESWWTAEFGFGFGALTESEALYLLRVDASTIRNRVAEARQDKGR